MEKIIFDKYLLRDNGTIKNLEKNFELKLTKNTQGYITVTLFFPIKDLNVNVSKVFYLHRLVAANFLKTDREIDKDTKIRHKDGDKTNNKVENLEIMTARTSQISIVADYIKFWNSLSNETQEKEIFQTIKNLVEELIDILDDETEQYYRVRLRHKIEAYLDLLKVLNEK